MVIVQTIIACFSVAHGFGKAEQLLVDGQLDYILKVPIWTFVTVMDVSTEIAIFAMPCWIVWSLHIPTSQKLIVLSSFVLRLPLIVVSIVHLKYIYSWRSAQYPFVAAVDVFVQLQVEAHFATMAATIPALGTFMKSLNTRWGALDAQGLDASYAMHSYPVGSQNISDAASRAQSVAQKAAVPVSSDANDYSWKMRTAHVTDVRTTSKQSDDSDQMIIRKTVDTCVEHDN
nr:hypothetical protein CFP56_32244 [Quercus suber]